MDLRKIVQDIKSSQSKHNGDWIDSQGNRNIHIARLTKENFSTIYGCFWNSIKDKLPKDHPLMETISHKIPEGKNPIINFDFYRETIKSEGKILWQKNK